MKLSDKRATFDMHTDYSPLSFHLFRRYVTEAESSNNRKMLLQIRGVDLSTQQDNLEVFP